MSRSDRTPLSRPKSRSDSPRPPRTRDASTERGTRRSTDAAESTPATVWTSGPEPVDPHQRWPASIIEKIITSFSHPGDRVAVLPWPTSTPSGGQDSQSNSGEAGLSGELLTTLVAIDSLHRTALTVRTGQSSPLLRLYRPTSRDPHPTTAPGDTSHGEAGQAGVGDVDLVIARFHPEHDRDAGDDRIAKLASRMLRSGGILAVLTHSTHIAGVLIDPTGLIVTAAQDTDLLYLQHIVALHLPIHRGHFARRAHIPEAIRRIVRRRAPSSGLQPHVRIHSDVLVFAQPRMQQSPPLALAHTAVTMGAHQ